MAQKTLATIGITLFASAILVSWGTSHWVRTRTFDPVDMPVSLEHGPIRTGEFDINLRETYWMSIQIDYSADDNYVDGRCPSKNLGNHWRVFRINRGSPTERELWARRDDSNDVYWLNRISRSAWEIRSGMGRARRSWLPKRASPAIRRIHFFAGVLRIWFSSRVSLPLAGRHRCDAAPTFIHPLASAKVSGKTGTANIPRTSPEESSREAAAPPNASDKRFVEFRGRLGKHSLHPDVYLCDGLARAISWPVRRS